MIKLDLTDRKILCELDENCRQSLQQIARKLRTSRAIVAYRIHRLEKEKIITNYISSINLGKFGYRTYKIYLKMHNLPDESFIDFVRKSPIVLHAQKTEGGYDYSLAIAAKSLAELDSFLSEFKGRFKELVQDFNVSLVVYTKIFKARKLLLGERKMLTKMEKYSGEEERLELDEKDRAILRVLSQQANLSMLELARKSRLSLDVVKYRLRQLSKEVILSNRIILNFSQLGYYHYIILVKGRRTTKEDDNKLFSWCAAKRNVLYCSKRIGPYDFEINAAIRNIEELNAFLGELKSEFREVLDSYETILNTKLLKLNYVPF